MLALKWSLWRAASISDPSPSENRVWAELRRCRPYLASWPSTMMGHRWQRIRTSIQRHAFVLENPHHQHLKPTPPASLRHAFVLENQHHQHAKPTPPATLRHAFVLENPHHEHLKPTPPATHRLSNNVESSVKIARLTYTHYHTVKDIVPIFPILATYLYAQSK